jgi:hypothetical protein
MVAPQKQLVQVMSMEQDGKKSGLLQGRDEICKYLNISRPTFENFVKWGLPVRFQNGRWYGHQGTIETYLQKWTNVISSKMAHKKEERK